MNQSRRRISNHGPLSRIMASNLESWLRISNHGFESRIMASNLESWLRISNHGFESRIMASNLESWLRISNHGFESRIMASNLESWLRISNRVRILLFLQSNRKFCGIYLDLCLFVPCFPAFFDLLISLGQQGTHDITLPLVQNGLNRWEFSYIQQNCFKIWFKELEH